MVYVQSIYLFKEIHKEDVSKVGGKGANLGEMTNAGFPVPDGFVVSANAYFLHVEQTGLMPKILRCLEGVNLENADELNQASSNVKEIILQTPMSEQLKAEIKKNYARLGNRPLVGNISTSDNVYVAVRSSATAEDLATASFAGQQETFLNVKGASELIEAVVKCWASLFTARAIYYRNRQGFETSKVGIAVVVQRMINSETSGIMFTADPASSDERKIVVEAGYGLGEAIVSGSITPDTYTLDKENLKILDKHISTQTWKYERALQGNKKIMIEAEKQSVQKIPDELVIEIADIGRKIEDHYKKPQDIEWAVENNKVYIVQSRAVTTLNKKEEKDQRLVTSNKVLVKGIAASPGVAVGKVRVVLDAKDINQVQVGDVICTTMTNPDWVPAMQKAKAIVTDEGGKTSHAAIVSRELGIPAVVGCMKATTVLKTGGKVTVDGYAGIIYEGAALKETDAFKQAQQNKVEEQAVKELSQIKQQLKEAEKQLLGNESAQQELEKWLSLTNCQVKVNVALPSTAEKAAQTQADGVGLLRAEHMITQTGEHPAEFIRNHQNDELTRVVKEGIKAVAIAFKGKPVWYRTFDARTDEYRQLKGGEQEAHEENPMMGWHGVRRDVDEPQMLAAQFKAIKELYDEGIQNVGVMIPFVVHPSELRAAKEVAQQQGLIPHKMIDFGIMVETPAAVWMMDAFISEGIDFVSFGTNDLTQLTLGADRNNEHVQRLFDELHPAILAQLQFAIEKCRKAGVTCSICGQAGSNPKMVEKLVYWGINSVSANVDAVHEVKKIVAETEKKFLVEQLRKQGLNI